jgi:surface polysaccharide O-acyltransferase-like enzyme
MKRNYSIDTLRTIATFLVVLIHVSAKYVDTAINNLSFSNSFWIANISDSFSRIAVPLFVLISGMFLLGRKESIIQFYKNRMSKILIPLISWTLIYLSLRILLDILTGSSVNVKSILTSVILGKPYYHMWYLYMIIGLYLVTPLINNTINHISRNTLWMSAILLMLFGMFNSFFDKFYDNNVHFLLWFVNYLGYFIIGYLIKDFKKNWSNILLLFVYALTSTLISILSYFTIITYNNLYFYGYLSPLVIISSLSFFKLFHQIELKKSIFSKISNLSFGVYLIHAAILCSIDLILKEFDISFDNATIGIPIKFSLTMVCSICITYVISKVKYVNRII